MAVPLAVCVPSRSFVHLDWAFALRELRVPAGTVFLKVVGEPVHAAREQLARRALMLGAENVLFIDDDTIPPPDAVEELLRLQLATGADVIGGLYWFKSGRPSAMRFRDDKTIAPLTSSEIDRKEVVPVDLLGFGLTLIATRVFEVHKPPWFDWQYDHATEAHTDETYKFFARLKACGDKVLLAPQIRARHLMLATREEDGALRVSVPGEE